MLEQTPLRPIQVDKRCDECGEGYYRPTGTMLTSMPPKFPHACTKCGDTKTFIEKYPTIRYTAEGTLLNLDEFKEIGY